MKDEGALETFSISIDPPRPITYNTLAPSDPPESSLLIHINSKHLVMTRHIRHPRSPSHICLLPPNLLLQPLNSRLIRSAHPIPHRTRQRFLPIRPLPQCRSRRILQHILNKPIAPPAPVRRRNSRCAIAALFDGDISVRSVIVGSIELELHPRGGDLGSPLEAALEGCGEGDEERFRGLHTSGFERVREVCAGGAVAVPEIVVEEVGACFS